MSSSLENREPRAQEQTPPQTKYSSKSRFPPDYVLLPPPQFTPTSATGGSTRPEGSPMTYEEYVNLTNEYKTMTEELRKYNEFRSSQPRPIAQPYLQRPNLDVDQSDSQKIGASSDPGDQDILQLKNQKRLAIL